MFKVYVTFIGAFYCASLVLNLANAVSEQVKCSVKETSDEA